MDNISTKSSQKTVNCSFSGVTNNQDIISTYKGKYGPRREKTCLGSCVVVKVGITVVSLGIICLSRVNGCLLHVITWSIF